MPISKIFHFSDTHLGFSEYNRISPLTGVNQREQDFYDAWGQAIEAILTIRPDLVLHAGDLFHTPRPSNRAIHAAMEGIRKISDAGIPMVLISGNHETPRIRATGSLFESLALFDRVTALHQSRYSCQVIDGVAIHCLPHCSLTEDLEMACREIAFSSSEEKQILLTHGVWGGGQEYGMGEFNEQKLPDIENRLGGNFDYIALGHYHRHIRIKPHICYCGSTERTSLSQAGYDCGYVVYDLDSKNLNHHVLQTRRMVRLPAIDAEGLSAAEIAAAAEKYAPMVQEGDIVSLALKNVPVEAVHRIDLRTMDELFASALHVDKQISLRMASTTGAAASAHIDSLQVEFDNYLHGLEMEESERQKTLQLGWRYLAEAGD